MKEGIAIWSKASVMDRDVGLQTVSQLRPCFRHFHATGHLRTRTEIFNHHCENSDEERLSKLSEVNRLSIVKKRTI